MDEPKSIKVSAEVERILDSCLTEEVLGQLVLRSLIFYDPKDEAARRRLFIELLDHASKTLRDQFERELSSQETMLILNKVRQLLMTWNLY